ncbi:hypothetical protein D9M71_493620 [compost metagenome]
MLGVALEALVQLHGGLEQQEHAAEQHDQVASGETLAEHLEQRAGQGHQPGHAGQQAQAHQQRQPQTDQPRAVALLGRQLVGKDGDEHQVVDAQHDFQDDQGQQPHPGRRIGDPFHNSQTLSGMQRTRSRTPTARWPACRRRADTGKAATQEARRAAGKAGGKAARGAKATGG